MSIIRPIIRMAAVAALKDKTWAGPRVFDSQLVPLSVAVLGQTNAPFIVCYTDTDSQPSLFNGGQLYSGETRRLNLQCEIAVASAVASPDGEPVIQFAETDASFELAVDAIESQVFGALFGDPTSQWGEIFKELIGQDYQISSVRGGQAATGIRYAARRATFTLSTIYDIVPGQSLPSTHPVSRFLRMCEYATPDLQGAGMLLSELVTQTPAADWKRAQANLGLSEAQARALGLPGVPLPWPERESAPLDRTDGDPFAPEMETIIPDQAS